MDINNYDQEVKETSRRIIWDNAISTVFRKRTHSTIFNSNFCQEYSLEAVRMLDQFVDEGFKSDQIINNITWRDYHDSKYANKGIKEIRVAYFSGPEPINDLKHLIASGIQPENIWAFELDPKIFARAKESILLNGIHINLFNGQISDYAEVYSEKFDIVYLDFTNSLLSRKNNPELLIQKLLKNGFLSDLSSLILNTCYPDKTKEAVEYLASFFSNREIVPSSILDNDSNSQFTGSFSQEGIYEFEEIKKIIDSNFESAYSEYSTICIDIHCNIIEPVSKILRIKRLKDEFFNSKEINGAIEILSNNDLKKFLESKDAIGFEMRLSPDSYSNWHFIEKICLLNINPFKSYYERTVTGQKFSPLDCIKLYYLMTSLSEGYFHTISKTVNESVFKMQAFTIDNVIGLGTIFCDLPMPRLWYNLLLGKYGHPYHINYSNHKRYSYKARTRKMCVDIFTLDKCRSLYDWIPSLDFASEKFKDFHNQIIIRSYMDKILKSLFGNFWRTQK